MKYSFVGKVQTLLLALVSKLMKKNENFSVLKWPSFHQQYPIIFICLIGIVDNTTIVYYKSNKLSTMRSRRTEGQIKLEFEFSFDYCSTTKVNE